MTVITHQLAMDIHSQRQIELARKLQLGLPARSPAPRRSLRRLAGRSFMRVGWAIEGHSGGLRLSA